MANKNTKGTTPVGEALFAHILKTEVFRKDGVDKDTGKFTIMLKLSEKAKAKLLADIEAEWDKYKSTLKDKKCSGDIVNGLKEYKDEEYFKFSANESFEFKGETIHQTIPVYDASCKEISKTLTGIGNGSKVRVAYELIPFHMSTKNFGISLRLTGIQIIDLIEYGTQSASNLGFGDEDGYSVEASDDDISAPDDDIPAPDDEDF